MQIKIENIEQHLKNNEPEIIEINQQVIFNILFICGFKNSMNLDFGKY